MSKSEILAHSVFSFALIIFAVAAAISSCAETADCDRNIKCPDGQLCFRSFCKVTCELSEDASDAQGTCPRDDQICRPCSGLCAGDDGMVCVDPDVCEPRCQESEECVDANCVQMTEEL